MKWGIWVGVVIAVFIALEASHLGPSLSDENTYFNMAALVAAGKVPYRDFFYAHPPLHLYLLRAALPFGLIALKLLPVLFAAGTAALLVYHLRKHHPYNIAATALYLFSYDPLRIMGYGTGLSEALFFFMLGIVLMRKHPLVAGAILAIGALFRYHVVIIVLPLLAWMLLKERNWRLAGAFIVVFGGLTIGAISLFGHNYFYDTVTYHILKQGTEPTILLRMILRNPLLWILGAYAVIRFGWAELSMVFYLLFLVIFRQPFNYYYLPLFLLFALVCWKLLSRIGKWSLAIVAISCVVSSALFFVNHEQAFPKANEIASYVRESRAVAVFGDDYSTPLIAYLSGKPIVAGLADINPARFAAEPGLADLVTEKLSERSSIVLSLQEDYPSGTMWYGELSSREFQRFLAVCEPGRDFPLGGNRIIRTYSCG